MADQLTVADYIKSLHQGWDIADYFAWPPDAFCLISTLFQITGCYRVALWKKFDFDLDGNKCSPTWRSRNWQKQIEDASKIWMENVANFLADDEQQEVSLDVKLGPAVAPSGTPFTLSLLLKEVQYLSKRTTLNDLKILRENLSDKDARTRKGLGNAIRLAHHLVTLNALADSASGGMGLPRLPFPDGALAGYYGNLLLTTYGSLSTLPKHLGVVLPKLRTPQSGVTIRSMAHHVTHHVTEVEVMWRTMPWPNQTENTLNILCFPLPLEFQEEAFKVQEETFESVRYFDYKPDRPDIEVLTDSILEQLRECEKSVEKVHLLIFPEMGLTEREFLLLLRKLESCDPPIKHIPFVISGVRNDGEYDPSNAKDNNGEHNPSNAKDHVDNEVRLAAYFSGSWYQTIQRKHHRWKLDGYQIRQYKLEGRMPTTRWWFEDIPVHQRRLTFVAPNGWLTLCPLICEDLAQLEPVAPVIRGVGPTLLLALLSDGPQLKHRWSGRYASILADDPGTAVLTLTSKAMAKQSRPGEMTPDDSSKPSPVISTDHWTVGLWKDQVKGWYPINLAQEHGAFLLTICSDRRQEFTIDGRSDDFQSARFRIEGHRPYTFFKDNLEKKANASSKKSETTTAESPIIGTWTDFRELSALIFAVDALICIQGKKNDINETDGNQQSTAEKARDKRKLEQDKKAQAGIIIRWLNALEPKQPSDEPRFDTLRRWLNERPNLENLSPRKYAMLELLSHAQQEPGSIGVDINEDSTWGEESLQNAMKIMVSKTADWLENLDLSDNYIEGCQVETWKQISKRIGDTLQELDVRDSEVKKFFDTVPRDGSNKLKKNIAKRRIFTWDGVRYQLCMITLQNLHFRLDEAVSEFSSYESSSVKDLPKANELMKTVIAQLKNNELRHGR